MSATGAPHSVLELILQTFITCYRKRSRIEDRSGRMNVRPTPMAAIIYCLVARDGIVLSEYAEDVGNFQTVTRLLLPRVPRTATRMSYLYDDHIFHHYFRDNGLCYMAMCAKGANISIPYLFLQDVASAVESLFSPRTLKSAIALSLNAHLAPLLEEKMHHWNKLFSVNSLCPEFAQLQSQIAEIHDVMVDNIDKIVARREKISLLVDRTGELRDDAVHFRRQAGRYHRKLWWQHRRCLFFLVLMITVLCISFSMFLCGGFLYPQCRRLAV